MLRWQKVLVAALLTASACGDDGESPAPAPATMVEGGVPDAGDAGLARGDAGALDASLVIMPARDSSIGAPDAPAMPLEASTGLGEAGPSANILGAANPCGAGPEPVAANIKLRELALYQAVKIPLYKDGTWVTTRNAAVVQGKKALVRAFVDTQSGFTPHTLRGVLSLENDGKASVLTSERNITRSSTDEDAESTLDFQVEGGLIDDATKVSLTVLETTCVAAPAGSSARLAVTALGADAIGKLNVVLVPVTVSGRTPDTGEAQLTKIRDALRAYYPVADVNVTAHAPLTYTGSLSSTGTGWSELLTQIGRQRQQDAVAGNVYYFGLISPAASFRDYCRSGCVLGLAPQTTFISRSNQIGLGVGFVDDNTYTTIVHELGHAHGIAHAPCVPRGGSIDGADTKYPYSGAKIGSWGWDSRSNKLMSPTTYADVMSYCDPTWISDYNYQKLATRSKSVNTAAYVFTGEKRAQRSLHGVILYADGRARWSGMTLSEESEALSSARALDENGDELTEVDVVRVPLSHSSDSFVYIPEPAADWATLDLGDRSLRLSDIQPAHD